MPKKTISWPLAPAHESKDRFSLKSQYDLYRRQVDGFEEGYLGAYLVSMWLGST